MIKETIKNRLEKTKKFVDEYKYEIGIGCLAIAGTIVGVKIGKNYIEEMKLENAEREFDRLYLEAYNKAVDITNDVLIPTINEKYKDYDFSLTDEITTKVFEQYNNEYYREYDKIMNEQLEIVMKK